MRERSRRASGSAFGARSVALEPNDLDGLEELDDRARVGSVAVCCFEGERVDGLGLAAVLEAWQLRCLDIRSFRCLLNHLCSVAVHFEMDSPF